MKEQITKKGFTLLELLIVITIIAVLSVILIVALNPVETLRKARDTQRMSDLASLKTAIGIYVTSKTSPQLDGTTGTANDKCVGGNGTQTLWVSATEGDITGTPPGDFVAFVRPVSFTAGSAIDGSGWIPVALSSITGGSPISNMPIDPVNDATGAFGDALLMYRYACDFEDLTFEINARLESSAFGPGGEDDRSARDGGNNDALFEVGTDLTLLP